VADSRTLSAGLRRSPSLQRGSGGMVSTGGGVARRLCSRSTTWKLWMMTASGGGATRLLLPRGSSSAWQGFGFGFGFRVGFWFGLGLGLGLGSGSGSG